MKHVVMTAAVEGGVDEAVVKRLVRHVGIELHRVFIAGGKPNLRRRVDGYNGAASHSPWVVLVDLDQDYECAVGLRDEWIREPAQFMCFRVAVREVEAWLLADPERFGAWFRVRPARVPKEPESLADPKRALVDAVRHSRLRAVREDMVPRPGSGRSEGPAYSSRLREFILDAKLGWRPSVAAKQADSLARTLACMRRLGERWPPH